MLVCAYIYTCRPTCTQISFCHANSVLIKGVSCNDYGIGLHHSVLPIMVVAYIVLILS